jgi:hypothetical protein
MMFWKKPLDPELAKVVFDLTPHAYEMRRAKKLDLPPKLMGVLMVVDGVCPVAQYQPFLQAFDPIGEKFLELEALGYLSRAGEVSGLAVSNFSDSIQGGSAAERLPRIDARAPASGFTPVGSK